MMRSCPTCLGRCRLGNDDRESRVTSQRGILRGRGGVEGGRGIRRISKSDRDAKPRHTSPPNPPKPTQNHNLLGKRVLKDKTTISTHSHPGPIGSPTLRTCDSRRYYNHLVGGSVVDLAVCVKDHRLAQPCQLRNL
jgi:hypothetical protein